MKKADVGTHRVGYGITSLPAVNVKVYRYPSQLTDQEWADATDLAGDELARFREWAEEWFDTEQSWWTFDTACESEREYLADWAPEILGRDAEVHYEGRQGGWAVVDGLPDVESWDAIALGRWAKFARIARAIADGIPAQMVGLAYLNVWEPDQEGRREDAELAMVEGVAT